MKQAKWVMCPLCEAVIWGGPGIHPIPRECDCKPAATFVIPLPEKGHVKWDAARYKAAGFEEPIIEWTEEALEPLAKGAVPQTLDSLYQKMAKDQFGE